MATPSATDVVAITTILKFNLGQIWNRQSLSMMKIAWHKILKDSHYQIFKPIHLLK